MVDDEPVLSLNAALHSRCDLPPAEMIPDAHMPSRALFKDCVGDFYEPQFLKTIRVLEDEDFARTTRLG